MRISRDNMLMGMADYASMRGTCSRLQVGAVVSRDGRVLTTGYNGAPSGLPHCQHFILEKGKGVPRWVADVMHEEDIMAPNRFPEYGTMFSTDGSKMVVAFRGSDGSCPISEHAERNAIAFAARYGLALDGAEMHVTHGPCANCARAIINSGVKRVTYRVPYRITEGVDLLTRAGVEVIEYIGDPA